MRILIPTLLLLAQISGGAGLTFSKAEDFDHGYFKDKGNKTVFVRTGSYSKIVLWHVEASTNTNGKKEIRGQVRHFNVGTPLPHVPVYLGKRGYKPSLVCKSDKKGFFDFQLAEFERGMFLYFMLEKEVNMNMEGDKVFFPSSFTRFDLSRIWHSN